MWSRCQQLFAHSPLSLLFFLLFEMRFSPPLGGEALLFFSSIFTVVIVSAPYLSSSPRDLTRRKTRLFRLSSPPNSTQWQRSRPGREGRAPSPASQSYATARRCGEPRAAVRPELALIGERAGNAPPACLLLTKRALVPSGCCKVLKRHHVDACTTPEWLEAVGSFLDAETGKQ